MSEDEVKLLTIENLKLNDTGTYLCRVLNEYGFTDLLHHLIVLPGKNRNLVENVFFIFLRFQEANRNLTKIENQSISFHVSEEMIVMIATIILVLVFAFIFFLIYHLRHEKTLRETLIAARLRGTRGINTLKAVKLAENRIVFSKRISSFRTNCIESTSIRKRNDRWSTIFLIDKFQVTQRSRVWFLLTTTIDANWTEKSLDRFSFLLRASIELFLCLFFSLVVGRLIGKGAFGLVHQGKYRTLNTEMSVAIKTVKGLVEEKKLFLFSKIRFFFLFCFKAMRRMKK